ncbi:MAG: tRNA1(Val) (adenine(37)-N6)-methyltransferase [Lachnospiraceae bacterium]|nr:tRNA1(Val) (adenine(37)-N6)-methyltransferase [Lachnospiraceae bacterium]
MTDIKETEQLVDLENNGLVLLQDKARFCFGMDAVLLSGFAQAKRGDRVLDMGTGTGILPILMSAKTEAAELVGLELQPESADMAERSVRLNHLEERVSIVTGDLCRASELFGKSSFDVVVSNPPYMTEGHGIVNPAEAKMIARHELFCTFSDVAREAAAVLKPGGHFYLVHRPFRLSELMVTLTEYKLEPKRMRLVYPFVDREPNMVLLECVRGGKARLTVEKPLIIWDKPGIYTEEVREKYGF